MRSTARRHACAFLAAALALCLAPSDASQIDAFKEHGVTLWPKVLELAGVSSELHAAAARYAEFVPTDVAVRDFLASMRLHSLDALAQRRELAKQLVGQHLVLALAPAAQAALARGDDVLGAPTAASASRNYSSVSVTRAGGRAVLTDGQGRRVNVVRSFQLAGGNKTAILIDSVLLSGHQYTSFSSLCAHRATSLASACTALRRLGLLANASALDGVTFFMPGSSGFARAHLAVNGSGALSERALRELLAFSTLRGPRAIPDGFTSGAWVATELEGQRLQVDFTAVNAPRAKPREAQAQAFVATAAGQRVQVVVHNVFVGTSVVQGIPAVLLPRGFAAAAASQAAAGAARGGGAAGASSAAGKPKSPVGRRLHGSGVDTFLPMNAAETNIRERTRSMFRDTEDRWS